jgi:hypothetical protein
VNGAGAREKPVGQGHGSAEAGEEVMRKRSRNLWAWSTDVRRRSVASKCGYGVTVIPERGPHPLRAFSLLQRQPVWYRGARFQSLEHAFRYQLGSICHMRKWPLHQIRKQDRPGAVRAAFRKAAVKLPSAMRVKAKLQGTVMNALTTVLRRFLEDNRECRELLKSTKGSYLVYQTEELDLGCTPREERLDGMGRMGVQDMVRGGPTVVIPGANYVGRTLMSLRHALFKAQGFPKDWPDRDLKRKITEEIVAMSLKRRRDSLLRSPEPVDAAVGENSNGSSVEIGDPNAEMEEPVDPLQDANLEEEALRELVTQGEDLMEDIVDQDGCQDEIKDESDEEDVGETEEGEDEPLLVLDEVEAEASSDMETPEPDEQQG